MNPNQIINLNNLTKVFNNNIIALNQINISIFPGITAVIGPNGSGKTTLFKILIGHLKPTSGSANVFSFDSWNESNIVREKLGVLLEDKLFPPNMTINEYLSVIKNFYSNSADFDIDKYISLPFNRTIGSLSSGMLRKLGIIQAFIGNPELVLLDEPTANLDPLARIDLIAFIRKLYNVFKINFIISSHNLSDLEQIATHFVILNEGIITFSGSLSELYKKFHSNIFEIHSNNIGEWIKKINFNPEIVSITTYDNICYVHIKDKMTSIEFFNRFINPNEDILSDFIIMRKFLDIEKIFFSPTSSVIKDQHFGD